MSVAAQPCPKCACDLQKQKPKLDFSYDRSTTPWYKPVEPRIFCQACNAELAIHCTLPKVHYLAAMCIGLALIEMEHLVGVTKLAAPAGVLATVIYMAYFRKRRTYHSLKAETNLGGPTDHTQA